MSAATPPVLGLEPKTILKGWQPAQGSHVNDHWHPCGMLNPSGEKQPVVSLRSTTGYRL